MSDEATPALVNPSAGSGKKALAALKASGSYVVTEMEPDGLEPALRKAIAARHRRVLVSGGDGTIAAAAAMLAGTGIELAVVPGGTLNHFARDHGIPTDHAKAAELGTAGAARPVDVAYVDDRLFLNTSSVGAYVHFVRTRERLERFLGYHLASVVAAFRLLGRIRPFVVELEIEGTTRRFRTSLVFIAVGERELRVPTLGSRVEGGRRGLHVMVVRGWTTARLVVLAFAALARGVRPMARTNHFESFIVDRVRVDLPRRHGTVAVDGELVSMTTPLEYRLARDALLLVADDPADGAVER